MKKQWVLGLLLGCLLTTSAAFADGTGDLQRLIRTPTDSAATQTDDGVIRLTPDDTKIIRLDQNAASVVVANPVHASVVLDSPRLLVVMPRQPGATSFLVLNAKGETIMTRQVIVTAAAKQKYVRVRRVCSANDATCVPAAYYYCPDGCYEVMPVAPDTSGATPPEVMGGSMIEDSAAPVTSNEPIEGPTNIPATPTEAQ